MIYAIYFITVAVLVAYLFRLFAERDFWQDEFHGLSEAYVSEVKELEADVALWTEQSLTYQKESMAMQQEYKALKRLWWNESSEE